MASTDLNLSRASAHEGEVEISAVNNDDDSKELETVNGANIPVSLSAFLVQQKISPNVIKELEKNQINRSVLVHIEAADLEVLSTQIINLSFVDKIKFKSAVKELQAQYQKANNIVKISNHEKTQINKIKNALEKAQGRKEELNTQIGRINKYKESMKAKIDKEMNLIIKQLGHRKQALYKQFDEWSAKKLREIGDELTTNNKYINRLTEISSSCRTLVESLNDSSKREIKIDEIIGNSVNESDPDFKKLISSKNESIADNANSTNVKFLNTKILINEVNKFGVIVSNGITKYKYDGYQQNMMNKKSVFKFPFNPRGKIQSTFDVKTIKSPFSPKIMESFRNKDSAKRNGVTLPKMPPMPMPPPSIPRLSPAPMRMGAFADLSKLRSCTDAMSFNRCSSRGRSSLSSNRRGYGGLRTQSTFSNLNLLSAKHLETPTSKLIHQRKSLAPKISTQKSKRSKTVNVI